eukprot:COSAG01_NODE_49453_length_372_cov_0.633700_1_plen_71_part_01
MQQYECTWWNGQHVHQLAVFATVYLSHKVGCTLCRCQCAGSAAFRWSLASTVVSHLASRSHTILRKVHEEF